MKRNTLEKVDSHRLKKHLTIIAHPRDPYENPHFLLEVQRYVERELESYGYHVEKFAFPFDGEVFENLTAFQKKPPDEPCLIIGSHFDAVPGSDGADDNASGMAAFLEAARLLSGTEALRKTQFVAFNLEEYSMTGSAHYACHFKKQKRKLIGMISLEMVAYTSHKKGSQNLPLSLRPFYPDVGDFLALVSDNGSRQFLKKVTAAFKKVKGLPVECLTVPAKGWLFPETRLSDHSPFWDVGYPAVLVTDTSFFRNPHYHSPSDRIETLDLEFLARVTEGIVHLASSAV